MWVDIDGNNMTTEQVRNFLRRAVGSPSAADHVRVGGIYFNGGIWFQRVS